MAKEIDPTSVYTYFLLYKVALSLSDVEKGVFTFIHFVSKESSDK